MTFASTLVVVLWLVVLGICAPQPRARVSDGQRVDTGRTVRIKTTPPLREIGANYFKALKQSQVWINIEPELLEGGPPPVLVNLTVAFPGVRLNHEPLSVAVRAQPRCYPKVFPDRVRQPILRFQLAGSTRIDLTETGAAYQWLASCSKSQPDTVIAHVPLTVVRQVAGTTNVKVEALGLRVALR